MIDRDQLAADIEDGRVILAGLQAAIAQIPDRPYLDTIRRYAIAYAGEYERELNQASAYPDQLPAEGETPIDELLQRLTDFLADYEHWQGEAEQLIADIDALFSQQMMLRGQGPGGDGYDQWALRLREIGDQIAHKRAALVPFLDRIASAPEEYATLMEEVFGYDIEFAGDFEDAQYIEQLTRLRDSNLAIVAYYDEVMADLEITGLDIFRQFFAAAGEDELGEPYTVRVVLGAEQDDTVEVPVSEGWTPLPGSVDDPTKLHSLYLGSNVTVATITHEFFHQLDRHFDLALSSDTESDVMNLATYLREVARNSLAPNQGLTFDRSTITSGASSLNENPEIFADLAMTAVLNGMDFIVRSDGIGDVVAFRNTRNARDVECALRQYFYQILMGETIDLTYQPCK